jgi:hypothetical protein
MWQYRTRWYRALDWPMLLVWLGVIAMCVAFWALAGMCAYWLLVPVWP